MNWLSNIWSKEPVVLLGFVSATIALVTAFGYNLTPTQTGAILAFIGALIAITRSQVVPVDTSRTQVLTALTMPVGKTEDDVKDLIASGAAVPSLSTPPSTVPGVPK